MYKPLNIYLCGQKAFGDAALAMIVEAGHKVLGVSAPVEDEKGRPDLLWSAAGRRFLQRMPSGALNAELLPAGVDVIVCAHSHDFVGRRTRDRARLGGIGYHPSLLPLHRGRDSIRWTLKMRERITGGSVYWLNDVIDGGPLAAQDWCFARNDDTPQTLWRRELFPLGLRLLHQVLDDIARDIIVRVPQDEGLATWEPGFNPPPLKRPDLPQLTDGRSTGLQYATSREQAQELRRRQAMH